MPDRGSQNATHRAGHGMSIATGDEQRFAPVGDQVGNATGVGADDAQTTCQCLHDADGGIVNVGRIDKDVGILQARR